MKLYRLGEAGLRIRLSREDLDAYSMTAQDLDCDSGRGRRVLREIFERAKEETGFDAVRGKIYVQMLPTDCGGCELYVTKLEKSVPAECFVFADFDSYFDAVQYAKETFSAYRELSSGRIYLLVPQDRVPAVLYEFGERISLPSPLFFKYKCRPIHRKDVQ